MLNWDLLCRSLWTDYSYNFCFYQVEGSYFQVSSNLLFESPDSIWNLYIYTIRKQTYNVAIDLVCLGRATRVKTLYVKDELGPVMQVILDRL